MKLEEVKKTIRDIYDFPQKGIIFRDLTTAFKDADALCTISEELKKRYEGLGVTKVVGIESRGFIGGAVLARDLGAGFGLAGFGRGSAGVRSGRGFAFAPFGLAFLARR